MLLPSTFVCIITLMWRMITHPPLVNPSKVPFPHAPHYCLCRRLTPNFRIRAEVGFNTRCSFPLTLKVYVITQQEKDSVPEWVPDDFLDPELPQVGWTEAREQQSQHETHRESGAAGTCRRCTEGETRGLWCWPGGVGAGVSRRQQDCCVVVRAVIRAVLCCVLALMQRKPITELKGTTVITHHFEAALEVRQQQVVMKRPVRTALCMHVSNACLNILYLEQRTSGMEWVALTLQYAGVTGHDAPQQA